MSKKSNLIIFLILVLVLTGQVSAQNKFGPRTDAFIKIFASGNYHMKATTTIDKVKAEMEFFLKGNRMATTISAAGETSRIITRDNKTYMIMDQMKMIMVLPAQGLAESAAVDTSGMSFTGSGTASFAGKNLPYEEYSEKDGSKSQFFIDGNKLAGIRSISKEETVDMVISVLDQNVPDSVFNVPSTGYQVQDMSNMKF